MHVRLSQPLLTRRYRDIARRRTGRPCRRSKRIINKKLAEGRALGDDLRLIDGTCLDKGVEIEGSAAMPAESRADIFTRA